MTYAQFLEFTFQDFWHWLGVFLLLAIAVNGIAQIFWAIYGGRRK